MVVHSLPLIEKLCFAFLVVTSVTWLKVILLFGIILHKKSCYLFRVCLLGCIYQGYLFVFCYFLCRSSCSMKSFTMIGTFRLVCISPLQFIFCIFLTVFLSGLTCQQNGHTELQPLWLSLLLILKCPVPLICKTCDFCLWKHWIQPYMEPDMITCSTPLFLFLRGGQ